MTIILSLTKIIGLFNLLLFVILGAVYVRKELNKPYTTLLKILLYIDFYITLSLLIILLIATSTLIY